MTRSHHAFDDSAAYERFVGHWGRAAGTLFLDWLRPPAHARWLDVGCGTGLFTELIVETRTPESVFALDPAQAQIEYARSKPIAERARFGCGDAQALPFTASEFEVVTSALVINFIPNRQRALSEMRRVVRHGGIVAGYVWDFAAEHSPSGPFRLGMRDAISDIPPLPGTEDSTLSALSELFAYADLEDIATTQFEVMVSFVDFESFWLAQTPSYSPTTKILAAMSQHARLRVMDAVRARLPIRADGAIEYTARANAIKARALRAKTP